MEAGRGVRHEAVMYSDFVIVGPPDDAAGIAGELDARTFAQLPQRRLPSFWRGDDSGTHVKEFGVWAAGIRACGRLVRLGGPGHGRRPHHGR